MSGSGDDAFDEQNEDGEAVEELTEASADDARGNEASAQTDAAGAAAAKSGAADGRVNDAEASGSDGAARPSDTADAPWPPRSSATAAGSAAPEDPRPTMKARIAMLKEEQKQLRATSKAKTREIRNAERRSKRLKAKVGGVTDDDLVEVLRARAEAKAAAGKQAVSARRASGEGESRSPPRRR